MKGNLFSCIHFCYIYHNEHSYSVCRERTNIFYVNSYRFINLYIQMQWAMDGKRERAMVGYTKQESLWILTFKV